MVILERQNNLAGLTIYIYDLIFTWGGIAYLKSIFKLCHSLQFVNACVTSCSIPQKTTNNKNATLKNIIKIFKVVLSAY